MIGSGRDKDFVADLLVFAAAALVMGLALLPREATDTAIPAGPDPALVHEIELVAIAHSASEQFPAEVQAQIGLTGEPLATRRGVLEELERRLTSLPPSPDLELVRLALATAWREDDLAHRGLHLFEDRFKSSAQPATGGSAQPGETARTAADAVDAVIAARLTRARPAVDALLELNAGRPAKDLAILETWLREVGASRWLVGLVRARHLANTNDPAQAALDAEMGEIAQSVALRHAMFFALGIGLVTLGALLFGLFPGVIRPRLLKGRLVRELSPSPFLIERTRRILLGWFAGAHLAGMLVAMALAVIGAQAFMQPLAGLASGLVGLLLIRHWGLPPEQTVSLFLLLDLGGPAEPEKRVRTGKKLLWAIPAVVAALAISVALTSFFEILNQMLIGGPPDTQNAIKQLLALDDTLSLVMLGLSAVLIAPLVEEIIFRGFLYRNLRDTVGKGLAAVVSGLVFGLVHLHPTLILPLTGLGIALALLYEWTGSLWVPIAAHMAFNLLTLVRVEAIWRI